MSQADRRTDDDTADKIVALRNAASWLLGQAEAVARVRALCRAQGEHAAQIITQPPALVLVADVLRALEGDPDATG